MKASERLYQVLREKGLDFFVSVPCKLLSDIISLIEKDKDLDLISFVDDIEGIIRIIKNQ